MQRISLPREGFYPIMVLAVAGVVNGLASVLRGSGFLAVFLAGLVIGDVRAPFKGEIERFHTSLASLAEIAAYVVERGSRAVGSTIRDLPLGDSVWISLVVRDGEAHQARGSLAIQPEDEIYVLGRGADGSAPQALREPLRLYMRSGASTPIRSSDRAITACVARQSARRNASASLPSTRWRW